MYRTTYLLSLVAILCSLLAFFSTYRDTGAQTDRQTDSTFVELFISPLPTPLAASLSPLAEIALHTIAEIEKMPLAELHVVSEEPLHFSVLDRACQYFVVVHPHKDAFGEFTVLVDPVTGVAEPDVEAVYQAEREAHLARYGKLHPDLYTRLQKTDDDERLPVAVWVVSSEQERQPQELVADVAKTYPQAADAFQEHGAPWLVDDPALADAIRNAYIEQLQANVAQNVDPLLRWLAEQGLAASSISGIPAVSATLIKAEIEQVASHPSVGEIYLLEDDSAPALDIATGTDRLPIAWQQGLNGNGIRIAIVEGDAGGTNINATADNCLDIVATLDAAYPDRDHISRVAAIAACNNNTLPGAAQGADILDGGFDTNNNSALAFADALV